MSPFVNVFRDASQRRRGQQKKSKSRKTIRQRKVHRTKKGHKFGRKMANWSKKKKNQKEKRRKDANWRQKKKNQKEKRRKVSNWRQKEKNQKQRRRRGRKESSTKLKRNSRSDCRRPNAESLVRQLYKKCEEAGVCMVNGEKIWESVNEIFARFSYVSPQLREYITTKELRRRYMYDGKTLTANTNAHRLIGPSFGQTSIYYPYGLSNIDGKFPDRFAGVNGTCPKVAHTMFNCYGECRSDNCNENPPKKGSIIVDNVVPRILSIPLHKFIAADLKDFSDPFEGQLGYVVDDKGRVKNEDGSFSFYKSNTKLIRSELTRISTWNGINIWDGIGRDPYEQMPGEDISLINQSLYYAYLIRNYA